MLPRVAGRLPFLAILAILSLSSCVVVAPQGATRRSRQACGRPNLVVATYNVRFDTRKDREHRWSRRREQVGELLRSMQADLIGLQEVESNQLDDLKAMLPDYRYEGVGRDDGVRAGEFSPLFWNARRFQREDGGTFWLSPTPDRPRRGWQFKPWGSWHNRIATWALLRDSVTEKWLLVVNTHFDHYSELARRNSARMLVKFIRQHTADHIIVMGDINARLRSEPVRILSTALDNTLLGARRVKRPRERTSVTVWTGLGAPGHHIDHVFVSPRLHPVSYEVVDRRLFYSGAERYPSDHLPVRVALCEESSRSRR